MLFLYGCVAGHLNPIRSINYNFFFFMEIVVSGTQLISVTVSIDKIALYFRPAAPCKFKLFFSRNGQSNPQSPSSSERAETTRSRSEQTEMADMDEKDRANGDRGVFVDAPDKSSSHHHHTLPGVLYALIATVLFPDHTSPAAGESLLQRAKISYSTNVPLLPHASRNSGHHLLHWTRRGSPLRALLVISVSGSTLLLSLALLSIVATVRSRSFIRRKVYDTISD